MQSDWDYVDKISKIIEEKDGKVYFVELEAILRRELSVTKLLTGLNTNQQRGMSLVQNRI